MTTYDHARHMKFLDREIRRLRTQRRRSLLMRRELRFQRGVGGEPSAGAR